ncbi:MAG: polymer-forming cytoskeletal protein [Polyangiaceae bacterium]|nr:polymer-forming cytoskeletal protein [Polyangiaceae bacterium]
MKFARTAKRLSVYNRRVESNSTGDSPRAPGARPTEITALLGRGTEFEGKLTFFGRVRIDGRFSGDIRGDDVLVIGEGAHVEGTIEVATCIVTAGEVRAQIRARDAIELYAPAKVVGSLRAPAIFIDRGVVFEGTCTMAPLDEPTQAPEAVEPVDPDTMAGESGG